MFRRVVRALPAILFALALAFSWVTAWYVTQNLLDSDTSSELVLANLLSRQNRVITSDWYYSNELRVIQTQLVYAPLFKLFSNWHLVRFLGVLILQTLLVLSYRYLTRRLGLSLRAFFLSAAMLVMPYSVAYGRIVLYHTFYLPFVALGFLLVGLYLAVLGQPREETRARRNIRFGLLLAVAFIAGLNGVRQLMITMVPLLAAAFLVMFRGNPAPEHGTGRYAGWRPVWLAAAVLALGGCGYLIYQHVFSKLYAFHLYDSIILGLIGPDNFTRLSQGFFAQFGFQAGREMLSLDGLLACGGILVTLYMIGVGLRALKTRSLRQDEPVDWMALLYATATLTMLAMFCFTRDNANYLLYFIPIAVWAVPVLGVQLEGVIALPSARKLLLIAICAVMLGNGIYNNLYYIDPKNKPVDYEGISAPETDTVESMQGVLAFLRENQYTLGYATFWNANVLTEMSNGTIPMVNIILDESDMTATLYDWLSDRNLRDPAFVAKQKVFVLLKGDEDQLFYNTSLSENAVYAYEDDNYMIFSYDNPTDPMDAMLAAE